MPGRVESGGTVYVKVDGQQYDFRGTAKIMLGGARREPIMGNDGSLQGYTTKYEASSAEFEITDSGGLSLQQLGSLTGTLTALLGNGKNYILANAFVTDPLELDAIEGKTTLKMAGDIEEITN